MAINKNLEHPKTIVTNTGTAVYSVIGYLGVVIGMTMAGVTGANFTFEGSINSTNGVDGTWLQLSGVRSNANTAESVTGALSATPAYSWDIPTDGCSWFRVRATAGTFGTVTIDAFRSETMADNQPYSQSTMTVNGAVGTTPGTPAQSFVNSAATTNATSVKNSAGTVTAIVASNINAASRFLKLYNKASAPTVGTDIPVLVVPIPAGSVVSVTLGANGLRFGTGIAFAITGAAADSDATAVAAGEVKVAIAHV